MHAFSSLKVRVMTALIVIACMALVGFATDNSDLVTASVAMLLLPGVVPVSFTLGATLVDDVVAAQLATASAAGVRRQVDASDHAMDRLRAGAENDSRGLTAAINIKMLQSTDPETDTDFNASVRTPYGMGPSGELVPSAATTTK